MSELKVIKIELNNHGKPIASIQGTTSYYGISKNDMFYSKSEADEVIEELEKKLDLYKRGWEESDRLNASIYAELRHHKCNGGVPLVGPGFPEAEWQVRDLKDGR